MRDQPVAGGEIDQQLPFLGRHETANIDQRDARPIDRRSLRCDGHDLGEGIAHKALVFKGS
jgi:hypothetical protein